MDNSKIIFKNQLLGQREGLVMALEIAKQQVKTLENMINTVDKSLMNMEVQ